MKYKVGDRVKIKDDFGYGKNYEIGINKKMEKYAGKIMTVREINGIAYKMQEDYKENICGWHWSEDMIEGKVDFIKSDLKDGDIVTYRNGDKRTKISNGLFNEDGSITNWLHTYKEDLTKEYKERKETDIIKVERPTGYETVFERKEEILDEAEKRYLRGVIRPFRNEIRHITIETGLKVDFLKIRFKDNDCMSFKNFKKDAMYRGMKRDKTYTLEQLGL